jgi:Uma2 family endonuclease
MAVISAKKPSTKMTWEEFLRWDDEFLRGEWVDGEVILMSPNTADHINLESFLIRLFAEYLEENPVGSMYHDQYVMKTSVPKRGRIPDLLFISAENEHRIKHTYLDGAADLAVEIISTESRKRDREIKFTEYAQSGVREYWLLDTEKQEATFYLLGEGGQYNNVLPDSDGVYHSEVVTGQWLKVDWLFQKPFPKMREIRKAWGII